jgi:U4/U6.U5 tri-snRNP-associated protein 1
LRSLATSLSVSLCLLLLQSVRAALGLKPLKDGPPQRGGRGAAPSGPEAAAAAAAVAQAAADDKAAALAARVATARERRAATEALRAQGTLGDASADVDDAWAWVSKSRTLKQAQAAAASVSARYDEQDEAAAGGAAGRGEYTGADLAGMRVHALGAEDLEDGETMVLTLKDRRILDDGDEDGDDDGVGLDQLENVRLAELRKREAARKAASKGKAPGFDDDGDVAMTLGGGGASGAAPPKALLAKYDDVSDGAGLVLGGAGLSTSAPGGGGLASDDVAAARTAAVKAKLAAAAAALGGGGASTGLQSDFYSAAEMAAAAAPADPAAAGGAPPVKKLRKKQKHGRGGEVRRVHADELIPMDQLAGPVAGDDVTGGGDRQRTTLDDEANVAWERFQAAKAKAAAASAQRIGSRLPAAAAAPVEPSGGGDGDDDESDRRLNAALERSRRVAAGTGPLGGERAVAALAASITRDAAGGDAAAGGGGNWLEATAEFVRSISVDKAAKRAQEHVAAAEAPDGIIGAPLIQAAEEVGNGDADAGPGAPSHGGGGSSKRRQYRRPGAAIEPADVDMDDDGAAAFAPGSAAGDEPSALLAPVLEPTGVAGGGSKGLGATLAMLKATGSLGEGVTWAGRNTDKKGEAVRVATEAAGIATRDASWQFDFKLDRFDEFGRKMTPKEAFRELCHRFHGIFPSKSKQEARLKQWHEEQKQLKARDNDTPLASAEHMRAATQRTATPFVVLSGSVKSSQVSDARGHYAVAADEQLLGLQQQQQQQGGGGQAPGGGDARGAILQDTGVITAAALAGQPPPLEGAAKVSFMLNLPQGGAGGVKRPGGGQDGGASKRQRTDE